MWDTVYRVVLGVVFVYVFIQLLCFIGLVVFGVWKGMVEPRLISDEHINAVAAELIRLYPDPNLEAFARQEKAWYNGDGAEQGYWYRVRKAVWVLT